MGNEDNKAKEQLPKELLELVSALVKYIDEADQKAEQVIEKKLESEGVKNVRGV